MDLDKIIQELNKPNRSDLDIIQEVLLLCDKRLCVAFALHCALDVKHLTTDKRSFDALDAVKAYLESGVEMPKAVVEAAYSVAYTANAATNAAYAAYAAYAAAYNAANAANATYAAYAASHAANAAAYAANAAASYAAANASHAAYYERMKSYLLALKELILDAVPEGAQCWLLRAAI